MTVVGRIRGKNMIDEELITKILEAGHRIKPGYNFRGIRVTEYYYGLFIVKPDKDYITYAAYLDVRDLSDYSKSDSFDRTLSFEPAKCYIILDDEEKVLKIKTPLKEKQAEVHTVINDNNECDPITAFLNSHEFEPFHIDRDKNQ